MSEPRPYGKLDDSKIIAGLMNGDSYDKIAENAGSTAKSRKSKSNIVSKRINNEEFKEKAKPFIERITAERDRALEAMINKKLDDVSYGDISKVVKDFSKVARLEEGLSTENMVVTWVDPEELKKEND